MKYDNKFSIIFGKISKTILNYWTVICKQPYEIIYLGILFKRKSWHFIILAFICDGNVQSSLQ